MSTISDEFLLYVSMLEEEQQTSMLSLAQWMGKVTLQPGTEITLDAFSLGPLSLGPRIIVRWFVRDGDAPVAEQREFRVVLPPHLRTRQDFLYWFKSVVREMAVEEVDYWFRFDGEPV